MPEQDGRLADNLVHFARALRAAGIPVGPGAVLDALAAVETAGIGAREDFYWILHAVLVKRHEHSLLFEQAFRIFFRRRGGIDKLIAAMLPQAPAPEKEKAPPGAQRFQEALLAARGEPERKPPELETDARSQCPTARCCRRRISADDRSEIRRWEAIKRRRYRRKSRRASCAARHGHRIDTAAPCAPAPAGGAST
jgi:uncharacterized protein with von Willebrand factor type A (vWA) domain